ncbi:MAG: outer membrane beta-barrel protein [Candidatus Auribacterota bacterium]|nr:outer membrane beta-barrel protein [Candidatus Auribacterota bacterium]
MKYFSTIYLAFLVLTGLWTGLTSSGYSEDLLELKPHLKLTGYYDDNIDFSPQSSSSDLYADISPGISGRLNLRWMPIDANYTYTRYQYRKRSDLTRDFHNCDIETTIPFTKTLSLRIKDRYDTVPLNVNQPESQPSNLTQRNTFSVKPAWIKRISRKMKFSIGYEYDRVDYISGTSGDNYYGHQFFFRWDGDLNRNLVLYQKDKYRMKYFNAAPDYTEFVPEAGIIGRLGRRLKFDISGGYSFEDIGGKSHRGYVYSIGGHWMVTSKIDLDALFRRERTVDIEGSPYTEEYYQLKLKYSPTKRFALKNDIRYYDNKFDDTNNRRINFKLGADYRVNKWVVINGGYIRIQNVGMPSEDSAEANRVYLGIEVVI